MTLLERTQVVTTRANTKNVHSDVSAGAVGESSLREGAVKVIEDAKAVESLFKGDEAAGARAVAAVPQLCHTRCVDDIVVGEELLNRVLRKRRHVEEHVWNCERKQSLGVLPRQHASQKPSLSCV